MVRRNAKPRTEEETQTRERALTALALMRREGLALNAAANAVGIDPKTVLRYVGSALRQKGERGDYHATAYDHIPRTLHFITPGGPLPVTVQDSRIASRIAEYMNAVRTYVHSGESSALESFRGESFEASGTTYRFLTDPETLDRLADAGVLAIEGLYRTVQGG
jgi:hypothetical protein